MPPSCPHCSSTFSYAPKSELSIFATTDSAYLCSDIYIHCHLAFRLQNPKSIRVSFRTHCNSPSYNTKDFLHWLKYTRRNPISQGTPSKKNPRQGILLGSKDFAAATPQNELNSIMKINLIEVFAPFSSA